MGTKEERVHREPGANYVNTCCKVVSIVSIDERGQMVLPKEIREKASIQSGDKLAIISWEKDGAICCISMVKLDEFNGMVKNLLSPMMQDITAIS